MTYKPPVWQEILKFFYDNGLRLKLKHSDDNEIMKELKISWETLIDNLNILLRRNLIKDVSDDNVHKKYELTEEGIKISSNIISHGDNLQQKRDQTNISWGMLVFTLIIAFGTLAELVVMIFDFDKGSPWSYVLIIFMLGFLYSIRDRRIIKFFL